MKCIICEKQINKKIGRFESCRKDIRLLKLMESMYLLQIIHNGGHLIDDKYEPGKITEFRLTKKTKNKMKKMWYENKSFICYTISQMEQPVSFPAIQNTLKQWESNVNVLSLMLEVMEKENLIGHFDKKL